MSTFWERFQEQLHQCGPQSWSTLFSSTEQIDTAKRVLASGAEDAADLQRARRLVAATTHPDTGLPIALPFRMAAHVPVNTVLLLGMLTSTSVVGTGVWQFLNQSFNALQFYANRNASNHISDETVLASYAGAVTSSVLVGVALRSAFGAVSAAGSAVPTMPRWRAAAAMSVPFLAAAAGKPLQIGLMRQDEWRTGVDVFAADGTRLGTSRIAGEVAVGQTVLIRTLYLFPMLYLPPLHALTMRHMPPALASSRWVSALTYVTLTALSSAYVTPGCMAIFEQRASLRVDKLEPEFHTMLHDGRPVDRVFFNKGL